MSTKEQDKPLLTQEDFDIIVQKHRRWLMDPSSNPQNKACFEGMTLRDIDMSNCRLQKADFTDATLRNVKATKSNFHGACFNGVDGHRCDFRGAKVTATSWIDAGFTDSDFKQVDFSKSDLTDATFE